MADDFKDVMGSPAKKKKANTPKSATVQDQQALVPSGTEPLPDLLKANAEAQAAFANESLKTAKNESVFINDLLEANDAAAQDIEDIHNNIRRISRLPEGVARTLGFFDGDFNIDVQKTRLSQTTSRYEKMHTRTVLQQSLASQRLKFFQTIAEQTRQSVDTNLRIRSAELENARHRLAMQSEERKQFELRVAGMSTDQLIAARQDAVQGKGPYANFVGLLDDEIRKDQAAEIQLSQAALDLQNGRRESSDRATIDALSVQSPFQLEALADQARKNGGTLDMETENGALLITMNHITQALQKSTDNEKNIAASIASVDIKPQIDEAQSLADRMDRLGKFGVSVQNSDALDNLVTIADDPESILNPSVLLESKANLEAASKQVDDAISDLAETYEDKDTQAAIKSYLTHGEFGSPQAARKVTEEFIATPGAIEASRFSSAYKTLGASVARKLDPINFGNVSDNDDVNIMDMVRMTQSTKESLGSAIEKTLADPAVAASARGSIQNKVVSEILDGAVGLLSNPTDQNPTPAPIWQEFNRAMKNGTFNVTNERTGQEQLSVSSMFNWLHRNSLTAEGQVLPIAENFRDALEASSSKTMSFYNDTSAMPVEDAALLQTLYGRSGLNDLATATVSTARQAFVQSQKQHQAALEQDLSGTTNKDAVLPLALSGTPLSVAAELATKEGSRAFSGRQANEVRAIFGAGESE